MINWILYNNSFLKRSIDSILFFIFNNKDYKYKECIWCHKKVKSVKIVNSWFCSKRCNRMYDKEKYQKFMHNNKCHNHSFENMTYRGECWICYKETFRKQKIGPYKKKIILWYHGFRIIPTLRTSDNGWNGDKIAFEQYLKDMKIGWFVYVKFYKDKNGKIIPLVLGKSGSIKVNGAGSDVNFSTLQTDGPARRFLASNKKIDWHYDHIAIRECHSEWAAYKIESKLMKKLKLFGS